MRNEIQITRKICVRIPIHLLYLCYMVSWQNKSNVYLFIHSPTPAAQHNMWHVLYLRWKKLTNFSISPSQKKRANKKISSIHKSKFCIFSPSVVHVFSSKCFIKRRHNQRLEQIWKCVVKCDEYFANRSGESRVTRGEQNDSMELMQKHHSNAIPQKKQNILMHPNENHYTYAHCTR